MPRQAGWEIGRVPGFYKGAGVPSASTLEAGNYDIGDYYINTSANTLYLCTTAGSASSSVWTQVGGSSLTKTAWILKSTQDIASGSAVNTVSFTGLAGDTDTEYLLIARLLSTAAGNAGITLRFNNDSGANYTYGGVNVDTGSVTGLNSSAQTGVVFGQVTQSKETSVWTHVYAKSGFNRTFESTSNNWGATGGSVNFQRWVNGAWLNTASNMTEIDIVGTSLYGHFELWVPAIPS